ncbi:uncharacterized protein LOC113272941 [Papaver somniferum]|uniref:uncharacterized protein LOC113272941 n=1 Tax=Papaver somniferum TaxID=3469 RepID=UPI000E704D3E|nr:uncharacterized protein LOC113272941 [Papaver somniferum]
MGFPDQFIEWIYVLFSLAKFSMLVNNSPYGYFPTSGSLRQGCPLSPYLFVIVMEVLSISLKLQVDVGSYGLHPRRRLTNLTHLCFANDILVFFKGSLAAADSVKHAIAMLSKISGLEMNKQKTTFFSSSVDSGTLSQILLCLDCSSSALPVRYCGVPLLSTRLSYQDCLPLISKIVKRSIKELNFICKKFLWAGVYMGIKYHPIGWDLVCRPLQECGLAVKNIEITNTAANLRHVSDLVIEKENIWNDWVHKNLIINRDFWNINIPQDLSWCWHQILDQREVAKNLIFHVLGTGSSVKFTSDLWHPCGHIYEWVNNSILEYIFPNSNCTVDHFIENAQWSFSQSHFVEVQNVISKLQIVEFNMGEKDIVVWKPRYIGSIL